MPFDLPRFIVVVCGSDSHPRSGPQLFNGETCHVFVLAGGDSGCMPETSQQRSGISTAAPEDIRQLAEPFEHSLLSF
jgi:hypothetical protein